jgi:hypothetical protein
MKTPTAEEFLKQSFEGYHPSQYNELHEVQKTRAEFAMKEFAKLHVEAALKAAERHSKMQDVSDDIKGSILNAYPLQLIK